MFEGRVRLLSERGEKRGGVSLGCTVSETGGCCCIEGLRRMCEELADMGIVVKGAMWL